MTAGRCITRYVFLVLCMTLASRALAATYTLPGGPLPPGCSFNPTQSAVQCPGNLNLGNNDTILVNAPTTMQIGSDFSFGNNFDVNVGGSFSDLTIFVGGNLNPGNGATINASLGVQGNINALNNSDLTGPIVVSGNLILGNNSTVSGGIDVSGTLNTGQNVTLTGSISATSVNLGQNNQINGNIETVNININGGNTVVDGNINATGTVNNNGTITGYVNAAAINNNGTILGPTCDLNENVGGCSGGGPGQPQYYRLIHSGSALTCESEPILVEACNDASCSTTLPVSGQVTIRAQGPQQVFATATFNQSGQASVSLALTNAGAYTLSVSAADIASISGHQCQSPSGCTMTSVNSALRFTQIGSQVAGQLFQAQLRIVRTDDETGACQVVAGALTEVELSLSCLNPGICARESPQSSLSFMSAQGTTISRQPLYTTVPASFDAQSALTLNLNHEDVGQVRVHARAQAQNGASLQGISNPFVVRPAGLAIQASNPIAYPEDIFARAGDPLQIRIQAVSATGAPTPSFGFETPPQTPTLTGTALTTSPAPGVNGSVILHATFIRSNAVPAAFINQDVRYTEAGIARFEAVLQNPLYLNSEPVSSLSAPVGRFVPFEFELDAATLSSACTAGSPDFSYLGQPFNVGAEVLAKNYLGGLTLNYPDTGAGDPMQFLAFDSDGQNDLSDRLSPDAVSPDWVSGVGSITAAQLTLERNAQGEPEAPIANLQLAILPDPLTAVGSSVPIAQADTSQSGPDCAQDQLCNARQFAAPGRWVYGRLEFSDTNGSEFDDVPIIARAQIWNGDRFILHRADGCTLMDPDLITVTDDPDSLSVQATGNPSPLRAGTAQREQFYFAAPNQGGEIRFEYDAPVWLRFGGNNNTDRPVAGAVFGTYAGHDRIHSWREVLNQGTLP